MSVLRFFLLATLALSVSGGQLYAQCINTLAFGTHTSPTVGNSATYLPGCWEEADNGNAASGPMNFGAGSWLQNGSLARINLFTTGKSDWLLTPEFNLSVGAWELVVEASGVNFGASPGTFSGMGNDDVVEVLVSTNGGSSWSVLLTFQASNPLPASPTDFPINLTGINGGNAQFGIRASEGSSGGPQDYYAQIHRFELRQTCSYATSINIDAQVSCPGFSDGTATVTPSGGTPPYTFLWSTGASTASLSGVPAGTYTVQVTDATGCLAQDTVMVTEPTVAGPSCVGVTPVPTFLNGA